MQMLEFSAMNTSVVLAAEGGEAVAKALDACQAYIEGAERRFSRFLPDSEVSELNRSCGEWTTVSEDLLDILSMSLGYFRETRGLFDPSILPALKRVGYDRSMVEIRARRDALPADSTRLDGPDFGRIEISQARNLVRLPPGMEIDLGGIAKGWIIEQSARLLEGCSSACAVSAGGDIVFRGAPNGTAGWHVNLEDPRDPDRAVLGLVLGDCAVATSSVAKRTWMQGGVRRHHIIDPRTGEPAMTQALSVTAIARDIVAAEVYAKVLLIGGEAERQRVASLRPELEFIIVRQDGSVQSGPIEQER
jgi:thiamine biosynthesis lipoprotein